VSCSSVASKSFAVSCPAGASCTDSCH
jgi:hypothetical protein